MLLAILTQEGAVTGFVSETEPTHAAGGLVLEALELFAPGAQGARVLPGMAARASQVGHFLPVYRDVFYNRMHISTTLLAMGNVVGDQARAVSLWNAFDYGIPVLTRTTLNPEGITLVGQPDPPFAMGPLEERVYEVQVDAEGPPALDSTIVWTFTGAPQLRLAITGARITPWTWRPDWAKGIGEALEWRTDIIEAEEGDEQRIGTRLTPRQTWEFNAIAQGRARRTLEAAMLGWGGRSWALPQWPHGVDLPAIAAAGTTSLAVSTFGRGFAPGGLAMLLGELAHVSEVVEILEVQANALVLKRPLRNQWNAGTAVYPASQAHFEGDPQADRFTGDVSDVRLRFITSAAVPHAELTGLPVYRTRPVFEDKPEWSRDPELIARRKQALMDNETGAITRRDRTGFPVLRQVHTWAPVGRIALDRIRRLQYLLRGARGSVWVPTWADDLKLAVVAPLAAANIDVEHCGYTAYLRGMPGRTDVRIESQTGAVTYHRITGSSVVSNDLERLSLEPALAATLDPFHPAGVRISFLSLVRMDTDRLEWAWYSGDMGADQAHANVPMPVRTFRHDL